MNAWWPAVAYWLISVYAMATVVLAACLIALGRIRQPARRLAVARWTLLVLLCVPFLALLTRASSAGSPLAVAQGAEVCDCNVSGAAATGGRMPTWAAVYVACSGLVVAWLAIGALASARLEMRTAEAPAPLQALLQRVVEDPARLPRLRVGGVTQPVAMGLLRPTIVLPLWFVETEPEAHVEAALAHEWAHLRRGDLWTLAVSRVLFVLFFAHPLFYVLRGRLRADQEALADAEAAGNGGKLAYAEALVGWARQTSNRSLGASLGLLGRSSMLRKRVALLLDSGFRVEPACPRAWTVAVRTAAVASLLGLSVLASTGVARTTLSALVPVPPPAVPHRHESAAPNLLCPSESAVPWWSGACLPKDIGCATGSR